MEDSKVKTMPSGSETRGRENVVPEIDIMLPEGTYQLRIDFLALAKIEEVTGRNMMEPSAFQNLSAAYILKVLLICIQRKQPQVSEEEIGRQLHLGNMAYVLQTLVKAWTLSMPKPDSQPPVGGAVPLQ